MKANFHPEAHREMIESARFYEGKSRGLGGDFLTAVETTTRRIEQNPEVGTIERASIRKGLVPGFPSTIFTKYSSIEFSSLPLCTNNDGLVIGRRAWNRALFKSIPDPNYILHLTYGWSSRKVGVEPSSAYSALSSSGTFQIT
jgi:hypothetical protein